MAAQVLEFLTQHGIAHLGTALVEQGGYDDLKFMQDMALRPSTPWSDIKEECGLSPADIDKLRAALADNAKGEMTAMLASREQRQSITPDEIFGPVKMGSKYHKYVSKPRHTAVGAQFEWLDNVLGGDVQEQTRFAKRVGSADLTELADGEYYLITYSNTVEEGFKKIFDQRPHAVSQTTQALRVFGDGMKSRANALTDGEGNLFVLAYRTHVPTGTSPSSDYEMKIGRFGGKLDSIVQEDDADELTRVVADWDYTNNRCLGVNPSKNKSTINLLVEGSPLEDDRDSVKPKNISKHFTRLLQYAKEHNLNNVFMEMIGPIASDADGKPLMQKDGDELQVLTPSGEFESVASVLASGYVPPTCSLATRDRAKPNPNTNLKVLVQGQEANLKDNLWDRNPNACSTEVPVVVKGVPIGLIVIKEVHDASFKQNADIDRQAGILVATKGGGRFLSRYPADFFAGELADTKCPILSLLNKVNSTGGAHCGLNSSIYKGSEQDPTSFTNAMHAEPPFTTEEFKDFYTLNKDKERVWRVLGTRHIGICQLHHYVQTNVSKTKFESGVVNTITLSTGASVQVSGAEVTGGIYSALVGHLFKEELAKLKAARVAPNRALTSAGSSAASSSAAAAAPEPRGSKRPVQETTPISKSKKSRSSGSSSALVLNATPVTEPKKAAPTKLTLNKKEFEKRAAKVLKQKTDADSKLTALVDLLKAKGYSL